MNWKKHYHPNGRMIKRKTKIMGVFSKEEYASMVYQILYDNTGVDKAVHYIKLFPDRIEFETIEVG